jgi:hypothetical protein
LGIIILVAVLIPFKVKAASYTYDVCSDSSCTYHDIDSVITKINDTDMTSSDTYTINIGKGTFDYANSSNEYISSKKANLIIKGIDANSSKINILNYLSIRGFNKVEVNNITFVGDNNSTSYYNAINFVENNSVNLKELKFVDFNSTSTQSYILLVSSNVDANLSNITINNSTSYYGIAFANNDYRFISNNTLDNVNINDIKVGVYVYDSECSGSMLSPTALQSFKRLVETSGSSSYGYVNLKINNSTIKSSTCSVVMSYEVTSCSPQKRQITTTGLAYVPNDVDTSSTDYTSISNSTFSCLNANQTGTTKETGPIIYADYTNTWLEAPTRGVNVLESGTGKVYYDLLTKKDVSIMVHNNSNLADIIPSSELTNITYEVEDETVARIVDNKVVGLRTGTTKVVARSGLNVYQFSVSVISNPTTDTALTVFVMLFVLVVLATVVTYTLKLETKMNN